LTIKTHNQTKYVLAKVPKQEECSFASSNYSGASWCFRFDSH